MRRILFASLLVQLAVASSLVYAILPVAGATYTPGVSAGNYVKFGSVSETYSSTDPNMQTKPQASKDIDNTAFFRLDINSVSGSNVTSKSTQSYNNGTAPKIMTMIEDVSTGASNSTMSFIPFLIAGGLGQGDKIVTTANAPTINQTLTRMYAGASRDTNSLTTTQSFGGNSFSFSIYWDKASGALVEVSTSSTSKSGSTQQYTTTQTLHFTATETNIWSATIFGLSPLIFYGIVGAIVAIIIIVAAIAMMRMRKPKVPAMTGPTGAPAPAPGP
jgi:hypothetical protein